MLGRTNRIVAVVGAAAGVGGAVAAASLPVYSSGGGSQTLVAANGDWVFGLLASFAFLRSALAREPAFRWLAVACGLALVAGSFVTVVGIFFLPGGVALLAAGLLPGRGRVSAARSATP